MRHVLRGFIFGWLAFFWLAPLYTISEDLLSVYRGMPVLVTGGCGFIGSHIVERLVQLGAQVTILDDCSTGTVDNIKNVYQHVSLINGSITDRETCLNASRGQRTIFHLAAFISVPQSMHDPARCHLVNVQGTLNMLEAARINGVERFIFSSSAAVYDARETVCHESSACLPSSPYGYSKLAGELFCQEYSRTLGLPTVIVRYFNVYGDRQNPHGSYAAVVAKFRDCMAHNAPITIFGDGLQTRDFVHVSRVVEANLLLAVAPLDQVMGQLFNIATGTSITLLDLIELLKVEFPLWNAPILFAPERPGDIKHSRADCSKYNQLFMKYSN